MLERIGWGKYKVNSTEEYVIKKNNIAKQIENTKKDLKEILKTLSRKDESTFGALKGTVSTKDITEEETHEELYS